VSSWVNLGLKNFGKLFLKEKLYGENNFNIDRENCIIEKRDRVIAVLLEYKSVLTISNLIKIGSAYPYL
jgi:hypothetical protein